MLLYIIRHGDPDYEHDCLTETGKRQAEALSHRLAVHGLDRIFCSPLGRARQTAAPTAEKLGLPVTIEDWLSENDAGSHFWVHFNEKDEGWIYQQNGAGLRGFANEGQYADWRKNDRLFDMDAAHCYDSVSKASDDFMERLGYKRENSVYKILTPNTERIAVFCHEGRTMTWVPHLLQIPPHLWWAHFAFSHTGVTVLEWSNDASGYTVPRILTWSDLSHIYADDELPLKYNGGIPL